MKKTMGHSWEILLPFRVQMGHEWGIRTIANFDHMASPQSISAPHQKNPMPQLIFYGVLGHYQETSRPASMYMTYKCNRLTG